MNAILEPLLRSPRFPRYVEELTATLRDEEAARSRFRASLRDDVRAEFINGEVVTHMSTRQLHTDTVRRLLMLLSAYVQVNRLGLVNAEHSLTAFTRNDYLPDICFWGGDKAEAISQQQLIYPVPDFICEVLSPTTARNDRGVKFEDYAAHGVGEYWIADPVTRAIEQHLLHDGAYVLKANCSEGDVTSAAIRGLVMPVAAAFDDEANLAALWKLAPQSR